MRWQCLCWLGGTFYHPSYWVERSVVLPLPHGYVVVIVVEGSVAYRRFDSFVTDAEHWGSRFRPSCLGFVCVHIR